jgi:hypothetical protein
MTRLISNSTRSSRAASTDGGTGPVGEVSSGMLAALLTLPPRRRSSSASAVLLCSWVARSRCSLIVPAHGRPGAGAVDGAAGPSPVPVSYTGRTGDRACGKSCLGVG